MSTSTWDPQSSSFRQVCPLVAMTHDDVLFLHVALHSLFSSLSENMPVCLGSKSLHTRLSMYRYIRPLWIRTHYSGWEQEALAIKAGFESAKHNEIAFGLMGVLVATKAKAGIVRSWWAFLTESFMWLRACGWNHECLNDWGVLYHIGGSHVKNDTRPLPLLLQLMRNKKVWVLQYRALLLYKEYLCYQIGTKGLMPLI